MNLRNERCSCNPSLRYSDTVIEKIQSRKKVKISIEKLSEVLIGTVSENFLYGSFSKSVLAMSIHKKRKVISLL